jgi:hypothetical protein
MGGIPGSNGFEDHTSVLNGGRPVTKRSTGKNAPAGSPAEPATIHNSGRLTLQFSFHVTVSRVRNVTKSVIPAKAGIHEISSRFFLDSGFRRNDELLMAITEIRQTKENP